MDDGTLVAPFTSNVILYLFAIHLAYNVISFVGLYGVSTLYPPVSDVYHPSKVYPSFVGVGNVISSPE